MKEEVLNKEKTLTKIEFSEIIEFQRVKKITLLTLPILGGMISQNVLNLVDTAMIGRLGAEQVAAVGLASIALWLLTSVLQGFSSAVQTLTARRLGEKDDKKIHESLVNALYICFFAGTPYMLILLLLIPFLFQFLTSDSVVIGYGISYITLRLVVLPIHGMNFSFRGYYNGLHTPKYYMQTLIIMHISNIFLNWVFIFGNLGFSAMGVKGAALASMLSVIIANFNYFRILLKTKNEYFTLSPKVITKSTISTLTKLAIPMCLQGVFLSAGFLAFFRITAYLGTNEVAATNILINLSLTCVLPAMAIGMALISLVGKSLGEGNKREAKLWSYSSAIIGVILLTSIGAILALFPEAIIKVFIKDPEVVEIAKIPLILLGITQIWDSLNNITMHVLLGGGEQKVVMKYSIITQWFIFLPFCLVLVIYFKAGLISLWLAMMGYRFLLTALFIKEFYKYKWLENKI